MKNAQDGMREKKESLKLFFPTRPFHHSIRLGPLTFRDPLLLCGVLYILLWMDAGGFLRAGLWAAFLHEMGHLLAYGMMLRKLPRVDVTMTGFCLRVPRESLRRAQLFGLTAAVYGLAAVRVILCMMPQNQWLSDGSPLSWGIYRNIPFALMGLLIIMLFYRSAKEHNDSAFRWMWLTIVLSFGFYIPVVLWANAIPMIGMLMIPKTCAYVWTVLIGYSAMKKECK